MGLPSNSRSLTKSMGKLNLDDLRDKSLPSDFIDSTSEDTIVKN